MVYIWGFWKYFGREEGSGDAVEEGKVIGLVIWYSGFWGGEVDRWVILKIGIVMGFICYFTFCCFFVFVLFKYLGKVFLIFYRLYERLRRRIKI